MAARRPEVVVFDYGNVLVGPLNRPAFVASQAALAHEYGFGSGQALWNHIYVSQAWEQAKRGRISYEAFWIDRLGLLGISDQEGRTAFKRRLFAHWGVFSEMRTLLHALKAREYRLGVLSNSARQGFRSYLEERRGFVDLFDVVISSAETGYAKPEEDIYRLVLDRLAVSPAAMLFIDDLPRNTEAAERLGIPAIVFTSPADLLVELRRLAVL